MRKDTFGKQVRAFDREWVASLSDEELEAEVAKAIPSDLLPAGGWAALDQDKKYELVLKLLAMDDETRVRRRF